MRSFLQSVCSCPGGTSLSQRNIGGDARVARHVIEAGAVPGDVAVNGVVLARNAPTTAARTPE
jgi:hypothetical protein